MLLTSIITLVRPLNLLPLIDFSHLYQNLPGKVVRIFDFRCFSKFNRLSYFFLAQIKLLQGAANAYHIESDPKFNQWFDSVLLLDEKEAFDLSCKMEPSGGVNGCTTSKDQQGIIDFTSRPQYTHKIPKLRSHICSFQSC